MAYISCCPRSRRPYPPLSVCNYLLKRIFPQLSMPLKAMARLIDRMASSQPCMYSFMPSVVTSVVPSPLTIILRLCILRSKSSISRRYLAFCNSTLLVGMLPPSSRPSDTFAGSSFCNSRTGAGGSRGRPRPWPVPQSIVAPCSFLLFTPYYFFQRALVSQYCGFHSSQYSGSVYFPTARHITFFHVTFPSV